MKSIGRQLVWLGLILLALLPIVEPLLHNHDADFSEHPDCPAHVVLLAFQSLDLPILSISLLFLVVALFFSFASPIFSTTRFLFSSLRAPPRSSL